MNPRAIVHVEIPFADREISKQFYKDLCGWNAYDVDDLPGGIYTTLSTANIGAALVEMNEQTQAGDVLVYIGSEDVASDLIQAEKLGGQILLAETLIQGLGTLGIFQDPSGNRIAFWKRAD